MATIGFAIGLDNETLRVAGAMIMLAVGAMLVVPRLQVAFAGMAAPISNWASARTAAFQGNGLWGQTGLGVLLGAVWSPCVGPTLGAATVLAAQGESLPAVAFIMAMFGLGAASVLAAIGYGARAIIARHRNRLHALALEVLTAEAASSARTQVPKKVRPPLMDQMLGLAHQRGLRVLAQARCISDAAAMICADDKSVAADVPAAFAAIAAIGPQTDASAKALAERAGTVEYWRRWRRQTGMIARWLLPYWERAATWAVAPTTLKAAPSSGGLLLIDELKPIRCRALICEAGASSYIGASALAPAPHDWDAPPSAVQSNAAALAAPPAAQPELELASNVSGPVSGAKLRRALARRSAPVLQSRSDSPGEHLV